MKEHGEHTGLDDSTQIGRGKEMTEIFHTQKRTTALDKKQLPFSKRTRQTTMNNAANLRNNQKGSSWKSTQGSSARRHLTMSSFPSLFPNRRKK